MKFRTTKKDFPGQTCPGLIEARVSVSLSPQNLPLSRANLPGPH